MPLKNLVYYKGDSPWTNAALTTVVPGWPNEKHTRDEHWAAYVDDSQWGIGVYSPGSPLSTNYRFNGGSSGPTGGSCSYFAPLRTFAITKGLVFRIRRLPEDRHGRRNPFPFRSDPDERRRRRRRSELPKGYFYIKDSNNLTVEEEASSPTTGYTYKLTATGADASFTTQRVADGISDKVLTFEYKSGKAISLAIVLDDITQTVYKIKPLSAASQWTTYSFDLGQQIAEAAWADRLPFPACDRRRGRNGARTPEPAYPGAQRRRIHAGRSPLPGTADRIRQPTGAFLKTLRIISATKPVTATCTNRPNLKQGNRTTRISSRRR